MLRRKSMAFESQSMKKEKKYSGVFGDMYTSVAIIPKDLELDKEAHPSPFELHFQFPDLSPIFLGFLRTREVGEFLSGALAGAMTKAVLAPLETISFVLVGNCGDQLCISDPAQSKTAFVTFKDAKALEIALLLSALVLGLHALVLDSSGKPTPLVLYHALLLQYVLTREASQ